jgi:hypothetical protein
MKIEVIVDRWICAFCSESFLRYKSQVRNKDRVFCSKNCKNNWQIENFKGDSNPNFRDGSYSQPSICSCGREKDLRSDKCSKCANRSFAVGQKNIINEVELLNIIQNSTSLLEAAKKLEIKRSTLTKYVKARNLDLIHFRPGRNRPMSKSNVFSLGDVIRRGTVKKHILRQNLKENKCSLCQLEPYWNNKKLNLELDHINGNPKDNRLENLRLLCPNCHSQTPTYCGRKRNLC